MKYFPAKFFFKKIKRQNPFKKPSKNFEACSISNFYMLFKKYYYKNKIFITESFDEEKFYCCEIYYFFVTINSTDCPETIECSTWSAAQLHNYLLNIVNDNKIYLDFNKIVYDVEIKILDYLMDFNYELKKIVDSRTNKEVWLFRICNSEIEYKNPNQFQNFYNSLKTNYSSISEKKIASLIDNFKFHF